ncbi:F-box/kelch-repeat protein At3g23880-like [Apium graveolens]|uniref:F-box/kelch-repeat protein At3g23880-like n=2 Tax=Apium graveolens TaxID=4045 RepID=UPI003D7AB6F8
MRSKKFKPMASHESTNPDTIPFIPEEIMYNVFLRLTVRDLSRCKGVCNSWRSIISSSHFIKTHLSKSSNDPHFTQHRLLSSYTPFNSDLQLKSCSIYSLLNEPHNIEALELEYPDTITYVVGYCNGLICLTGRGNYVFFWNPSTRNSRKLPMLDTITRRYKHITYGFCYNELADDFKVFAVATTDWKHEMSVYSSKSDSWRLIGDFVSYKLPSGGYLGNGAMHWLVTPNLQLKDVPQRFPYIISLDVIRDTFREVMLPNCGEAIMTWSVGTFCENLCVLRKMSLDARVELWVMRDCGDQDSWIKLFTIPHMDRLNRSLYVTPTPICTSVNGDIMLLVDSTIVLYDTKDNTFRDLLNNRSCLSSKVYTYVESLVSPSL